MIHTSKKTRKARKGFSLVELVVVILIIAILAVAVFAGGSAVIKKSQVSRTTSDLHNFSVAIETFMNENPSVANASGTTNFATGTDSFVKALNANLPQDYQLNETAVSDTTASVANSGGNITLNTAAAANAVVYESVKTDAWDNHYYVIFDSYERHGSSNSDFYITVVSAGADAKTDLAGEIGGAVDDNKIDDVFLLVQYMNGDVTAVTYSMESAELMKYDATNGVATLSVSEGPLYSAKDDATAALCPINF